MLVLNTNNQEGGGQPSNQMLSKYPDFDMILLRPESSTLLCADWSLASSPIATTISWTPVNIWVSVLDSEMRYKGTPNTASDVGSNSELVFRSESTVDRPASVNTSATYTFWGRIWDIFRPFVDSNVVWDEMKRLLRVAPWLTYGNNTRPIMRNPTLTITIEPKLLHSDWTLTTIFSKDYSLTWSESISTNAYGTEQTINIVESWLNTATATEWDLIVLDITGEVSYTKYNSYTTAYTAYPAMKIDFGYQWSVSQDNQPRPFQLWIDV